jgi:hypothetical protein
MAQVLNFAAERSALRQRARVAHAVERVVAGLIRELGDGLRWAAEPGGTEAFAGLVAERLAGHPDFVGPLTVEVR